MRNVVNISLPPSLNKLIDREVRKEGYASKSEFFRYLLRLWKDKKLADQLEKDRQNFDKGKGKVLKSFKDI